MKDGSLCSFLFQARERRSYNGHAFDSSIEQGLKYISILRKVMIHINVTARIFRVVLNSCAGASALLIQSISTQSNIRTNWSQTTRRELKLAARR